MRLLKQPLIVGYILAGVIVGPYLLNIVESTEEIELFSKMGIAILLFIVGLNLSPKVIKSEGKLAFTAGILQVVITAIIAYFISTLLGYNVISSVYIALAVTFSSTIIVLKLLSDKGDLDKLHGKLSIGFLIVQDIAASLILIFIASVAETSSGNTLELVGLMIVKAAFIFLTLYFVSVHLLPRVVKFTAGSQELLFLFSITWGLGMAVLFSIMGFSIEIGALAAGVSLSLTPFAAEIGSRMKPLRDFFIVIFFVLLGSQIKVDNIGNLILPVIILSAFVLIAKPAIVITILNVLGFKRRTTFLSGISLAQVSEFSLILVSLGFTLGVISQDVLSLIAVIALITITGSTYLITYGDQLFAKLQNYIKFLEVKEVKREMRNSKDNHEMLLFGYDRVGEDFIKAFNKLEKNYLVVDYNPDSITRLNSKEIPYKYGDAEDVEFLQELNFKQIRLFVSTIPDSNTNKLLVTKSLEENPKIISIVISHDAEEARDLYDAGATYVIMPHHIGADHASRMLTTHGTDKKAYLKEKDKHLAKLEKRER
ncbi:cation:proton antiporter [Candidatus Dojkabacteria bacterium]|uniref:Cation:proton antiporter n=1 Tax=Candidatus Dojkabacteria bacterium TaxID=2099670 RepID=A0A955L3G0_9BACT|nr:cation:proton antiporter [Candidatus Dojkabacteria bacterium]